jgi:hypothetical protein
MDPIQLKEILDKREQIMKKSDEYIDVPDDDDLSHTENKIYREKKVLMKYNFAKSMEDLTQTVKLYLEKERTRKINWAIGSYFVSFVGISGLLVLNDYILLNYFV